VAAAVPESVSDVGLGGDSGGTDVTAGQSWKITIISISNSQVISPSTKKFYYMRP